MKRLFSRQQVKADWPSEVPCPIAIVGEAPGEAEARMGRPFVGSSGAYLDRWLEEAEVDRAACLVTNVFTERPPGNDVGAFFVGSNHERACKTYPKHERGYLDLRHEYEIERLGRELLEVQPRVILAVGGTALWATTGHGKITKVRGTILPSILVPGAKVIATFHPSFIMRGNQGHDETCIADIRKAKAFALGGAEVSKREVWINPTLADLMRFEHLYLDSAEIVCYDIETEWKELRLIKCIGIAASPEVAIVVPFMTEDCKSYWATPQAEVLAWEWVKRILENPKTRKLAHNTVYDATWLRDLGIVIQGKPLDSMLQAHALDPERKKDLGFLGSLHSNEAAWKTMVSHSKSNKRDS